MYFSWILISFYEKNIIIICCWFKLFLYVRFDVLLTVIPSIFHGHLCLKFVYVNWKFKLIKTLFTDLRNLTVNHFEPPLSNDQTRVAPEGSLFQQTCLSPPSIPPATVLWLSPGGHIVSFDISFFSPLITYIKLKLNFLS